jgi:tRNA modification GTPase
VLSTDDTIAAIASAPGGAARGIVRLSGPAAISIVDTCFRPRPEQPLNTICSATALGGTLKLAASALCDVPAEVYIWPNKRSYTRQKVVEIHTLGSPPLVSAVLKAVCLAGARPAEPGEFTLRAFLAGRIDLTQAEAVLGIIDARGEQDFKTALAQLAGGLARPLDQARDALLELLAQLEAGLDFVEEDIQFVTRQQIEKELDAASDIIAQAEAQLAGREHCDASVRAALVGWPNVGKSSLFNALSQQAAALVSNEPGTTRDYLVATLDLDGLRCQLIDTAGVAPDGSGTSIAGMAQQLAAAQTRDCDIRLLCLDASRPVNDWERRELAANHNAKQLVILTKCDIPHRTEAPSDAIETSALAGLGLDALRCALHGAVLGVLRSESAAGMTAQRCAQSIRATGQALGRARELNRAAGGEELIAWEIRAALTELGKVVGAVYSDDILDRIFSRFCIGK